MKRTGRWRFSQYVGWLGDFLHIFVTDPPTVLGEIAGANYRSGKARIHAGSDGTILMQSVAEIVLERVIRIPVPIPAENMDDPEKWTKEQIATLDASFLKNKWNKGSDLPKDICQTIYQMREYSRYLSQYATLARFLQLQEKGMFTVPSESNTPEPDWTNKEKDRQGAVTPLFYDAYACIRIMRDGSILVLSGDGCSIVMSRGNVRASAVRTLTLEAGADMEFVAGRNMFFRAKNDMQFAADRGIIFHAVGWIKQLCTKGVIWLRSEAVMEGAEPAVGSTEVTGEGDEAKINPNCGVIIESKQNAVYVGSQYLVTRVMNDIRVKTVVGNLELQCMNILVKGMNLQVKMNKIWINATSMLHKVITFDIHKAMRVRAGVVECVNILTAKMGSFKGGVFSKKFEHPNHKGMQHVFKISDDAKDPETEDEGAYVMDPAEPSVENPSDIEEIEGKPKLEKYESPVERFQSHAQQRIADDGLGDPWDNIAKTSVFGGTPWPGENAKMLTPAAVTALNVPSSATGANLPARQSATSGTFQFKALPADPASDKDEKV
jgi:hypothetical protein